MAPRRRAWAASHSIDAPFPCPKARAVSSFPSQTPVFPPDCFGRRALAYRSRPLALRDASWEFSCNRTNLRHSRGLGWDGVPGRERAGSSPSARPLHDTTPHSAAEAPAKEAFAKGSGSL